MKKEDSANEKEKYFTREEAEVKIHRRVRTIVSVKGIPLGTVGTVVRSEFLLTRNGYCLIIRWDLPANHKPRRNDWQNPEDWFNETMYQELLTEVLN